MKYLDNMKNGEKVVICPWWYVNKTMFARKSIDGAIPCPKDHFIQAEKNNS